MAIKTENYTGADCSGSSGDQNRVLTLSNNGPTRQNGFLIYVDGLALSITVDYTVVHNSTNSQVTFLNRLWDDMEIIANYYEGSTPISVSGTDVVSRLSDGFLTALSLAGRPIKIQYFTQTTGSVYDDSGPFVQSGADLFISGIVFPLKNREGSEDSVLLEQGKLQDKDKKLYVNGSIDFSNLDHIVKVHLGSPTGEVYSTIPLGGKAPEVASEKIYKKQYIRYLQTGSF